MVCFCVAFVCFVFLFGNYVKDEPPKENTLWMVQRETSINGNLAKVKFKLRISGEVFFFFSLSEGFSKPKCSNVIRGITEIREDSKSFGKIIVRKLLHFHQVEVERKFHVVGLF